MLSGSFSMYFSFSWNTMLPRIHEDLAEVYIFFPLFLSHHLFGYARIHWNAFTRCQNSGNSTLFGSRERRDEVIAGGVSKRKWGECLSQWQKRQSAACYSPKVVSVLWELISNGGLRNWWCTEAPLVFNRRITTWWFRTIHYTGLGCAQRATNSGWQFDNLSNPQV